MTDGADMEEIDGVGREEEVEMVTSSLSSLVLSISSRHTILYI